jgi:heme exporter protein CcmD
MFGLDKYTDPVLLAYGVSIIMLGILIAVSLIKSKRIKRELDTQEAKSNGKN